MFIDNIVRRKVTDRALVGSGGRRRVGDLEQ
jgi:hypothetical protein